MNSLHVVNVSKNNNTGVRAAQSKVAQPWQRAIPHTNSQSTSAKSVDTMIVTRASLNMREYAGYNHSRRTMLVVIHSVHFIIVHTSVRDFRVCDWLKDHT